MANKGFTLIEVMLVLVLLGIVSVFATQKTSSLIFDGKVEQMELEVEILLKHMEIVRNTANTTNRVGGIYNRTYKTLAAGSSVSDLNLLLVNDTFSSVTNPFGFDYSLEITDKLSIVTSTIPGTIEYGFAPYTLSGGNTHITFNSLLVNSSNSFTSSVSIVQKSLYLEESRH